MKVSGNGLRRMIVSLLKAIGNSCNIINPDTYSDTFKIQMSIIN